MKTPDDLSPLEIFGGGILNEPPDPDACSEDYNLQQVGPNLIRICARSKERKFYEDLIKLTSIVRGEVVKVSHGCCGGCQARLEKELDEMDSEE